jgi:hypothetical protein
MIIVSTSRTVIKYENSYKQLQVYYAVNKLKCGSTIHGYKLLSLAKSCDINKIQSVAMDILGTMELK